MNYLINCVPTGPGDRARTTPKSSGTALYPDSDASLAKHHFLMSSGPRLMLADSPFHTHL